MENIQKYLEFIQEFHEGRDYFKCHEILEDIWIEETGCKTKIHPAIKLLLVAVGAHHWRNRNLRGASIVFERSLTNFNEIKEKIDEIGINSDELDKIIKTKIICIKNGFEYEDFDLPYKK
ncbi:DUF309 domain-containing protein [Cetobacterium sp. 2A]|uniref:DUF309 domain-containing protein n=1 Tax=unclassified Cetobacterium TaxID=2630983 RepID=UPI00163BB8A0|nr:DUF309 domain-containing protein [Cetobacterium sp. 2A]MBC2855165.1 DUF309 domain-containing protein [Cetobacterium sp. 2A]